MASSLAVTKPSKGRSPSRPRPQLASPPVETLHNNLARTYTHIHPLLVLSAYIAQFSAIVADPVSGLATALIPLSVFQTLYSVLCLPAAGSSTGAPAGKSGGRKKHAAKSVYSGKVVTAVLSLILSTLLGTPLLAVLLVCFGAPVTTHLPHTLLCAAHIAYLAGVPLVYAHGVDGPKWKELVAVMAPGDDVFGAAVGTLVGAWCGAIPIPLDWDREWQKWPVTIVCGAYAGFAVGKLLGGTVFKGKVFSFN